MERLVGRPFPLRKEQIADGLKGLPGVKVASLTEGDTDTGLRELATVVQFERLDALLRWELLARRTFRLEPYLKPGEKESREKPAICKFYMEPVAQVPVLDRVGALLNAAESPPPKAEGPPAARDPGPLGRLGLERESAGRQRVHQSAEPADGRIENHHRPLPTRRPPLDRDLDVVLVIRCQFRSAKRTAHHLIMN